MSVLFRGCDAVVTSADAPVLRDVDLLTEGNRIAAIGADLAAPEGARVIEAAGLVLYPGLINTHDHFFQSFVRNRAELDWTRLSLIEWLDTIYPIFARLDEDCFYHSSVVTMAELIKHGCTTSFDHQYAFPDHAGPRLVDRQIEAAGLLGMRFVAGRGGNTLPKSQGSTIPDALCETTDGFIADCARLIDTYHQPDPFAMVQVAVAPCQPVNCWRETFEQSVALARSTGVRLHTHAGEGESPVIAARHGMRTIDYLEEIGFAGEDTWLAHCWELTRGELGQLAASGTGVAHCPEPVYLVGAEVTDIPAMEALGLRIGLGADGAASNDNSNLMHCLHSGYMLQCLVARDRADPVPRPAAFLRYATEGGADLLGRPELGRLAPGQAADLFAVDMRGLDFVGTRHDPVSLPAKVGLGAPVDLTMIDGRVVWANGEFPGLDERDLAHAAETAMTRALGA
ncbi:amidohydrolase [Mesobaculum littorinae]|uniref:Amidohydrolase n=1 Tax=Mesobaculum littorinae TaxID=2486419 RepID=A0A438AJV3_9RHOB|nr:amidohydrolase [Mesobaculum littorinae]RVV98924.1 amidohydrolase [Mesobaculum littorinae]